MSPDNPLCPQLGRASWAYVPYIQVCMGRHLICVWGYSILVWGSYIAVLCPVLVWCTQSAIHACVHAWMAQACNIYRYIAICKKLYCAWKPPSVTSTWYSKLLRIRIWDRYSSHMHMGYPVRVWDNIRILGRL